MFSRNSARRALSANTAFQGVLIAAILAPTSPAFAQAVLPRPDRSFEGKVGTSPTSSTPSWPSRTVAPAKSPNVLVILTDDIGFGASSTFGGPLPTPTLDKLGIAGARYNNFNTTSMCSPTRAALLTGRNAHAVGSGAITDVASGYPGYNSVIPQSAATMARILRDNGYNTAMFGKHHNIPRWEASLTGPFNHWPTGLGFEYFMGFIIGDTNQWQPRLYRNTTSIDAPGNTSTFDAYMADDAIHWIHQQKAVAPDKPFLVYYATGTGHGPHQAPADWIAKFKGRFDRGWDAIRQETFDRQRKMGIIPSDARLTPRPDALPAWSSLTLPERQVAAKHMEVYAATVAYRDAQIGRMIDELKRMGQFDNTLIVYIEGDNGASGEGGLRGTFNEIGYHRNGLHSRTTADDLKHLDELGGPDSYPLYPAGWGWAMNTPFQWTKQIASHLGGIRNGMVLSWPGHIEPSKTVRGQFAHISDVMPTILEATGIAAPSKVDGVQQQPITGKSLSYTFHDPKAVEPPRTQYFEMLANRSIYSNGWLANTKPRRVPWELSAPPGDPSTSYEWELYDLKHDFSQSKDLASANPAKLSEMKQLFDGEAKKYQVYPLDDRINAERQGAGRRHYEEKRSEYVYWGKSLSIAEDEAPVFAGKSFRIDVDVNLAKGDQGGPLMARGSWFGGWSFYLMNGVPTALVAQSERKEDQFLVSGTRPLPLGRSRITYTFKAASQKRDTAGELCILVENVQEHCGQVTRTPASDAGQGETIDIGVDTGAPVSKDYKVGEPFSGDLQKLTFRLLD